jgi:hypothetical protein
MHLSTGHALPSLRALASHYSFQTSSIPPPFGWMISLFDSVPGDRLSLAIILPFYLSLSSLISQVIAHLTLFNIGMALTACIFCLDPQIPLYALSTFFRELLSIACCSSALISLDVAFQNINSVLLLDNADLHRHYSWNSPLNHSFFGLSPDIHFFRSLIHQVHFKSILLLIRLLAILTTDPQLLRIPDYPSSLKTIAHTHTTSLAFQIPQKYLIETTSFTFTVKV